MSRPFLVSFRRRLTCALFAGLFGLLAFGGCASSGPAPMLDNDLESFTAGIDAILQTGMSLKEARAVIQEKLPPPAIATQMPAPVPSPNASQRTYREIMTWPTFDHGTSLTLTIYCDHERIVVRWTTGVLRENEK